MIDESLGIPDSAVAVNLSEDTNFTEPTIIYVGTTGDVKVDAWKDGTEITFVGLPAGAIIPVQVSKVYSTANGTSASNLVAGY